MRLPAVCALFFVLPACSLLHDEAEGPVARAVEIQTTRDVYRVGPDLVVEVEVVNTLEERVFYDICGQISLEELDGGAVSRSWNLRYVRCYAVDALDPADPQVVRFDYHGLAGLAVGARFGPSVRYRFRFSPFSRDALFSPASTLDEANQYSNEFAAIR